MTQLRRISNPTFEFAGLGTCPSSGLDRDNEDDMLKIKHTNIGTL